VQRLTRADALAQARRGELRDGKSILALLWANDFLPTPV
jgi:hypothetical protein